MKLAKLNGGPEIFHTIQGEGKSLGKPSIFVRTSLCNLHCIWCDTDYTWNWKGTPFPHYFDKREGYTKYEKDEWILDLPVSEVADIIQGIPCKNIIFTGGEPLMHEKDFVDLMKTLRAQDENYWFEIETNGTLTPKAEFDQLIDQYNVSPKLSNSNNPVKLRERAKTYEFFSQHTKANFKYVIDEESDLDEVLSLIDKYGICSKKVYLMPQGSSQAQLLRKQRWLIEICKTYGFNYSDRLHIHIYGEKRGV